jgi:two-component system, cell cycle sensor histidine kinase and response regulator CckA
MLAEDEFCMKHVSSPRVPPRLIAIFAILVAALLFGGVLFFVLERNRMTKDAESDLASIALLKAVQIAQWRADHLADAAIFSARESVSRGFAALLQGTDNGDSRDLVSEMRAFLDARGYHDILLVDPAGRVRASLAGKLQLLGPDGLVISTLNIGMGRPFLGELSDAPGTLPIHLDVFAPILSVGAAKVVEGWIVFRIDPSDALFSLIQSWPTPSTTAETLLVRRLGDEVLYLNELRHQKGTALKLRIPLSKADVPAVMAARGQTGLVYGRDYRGKRVVAVIDAIDGSAWSIIAKEDRVEILASARRVSALVLGVFIGLAGCALGVFFMMWQRNEKTHFAERLRIEVAQRTSEERHRVTLLSVGDGVIATDATGIVTIMNPSAEELTGWTNDEALGKPLEEVFTVVEERTRKDVVNPVRRAIAEGVIVGLANHSVLIRRDGGEHAIADSGAPIRNEKGEIEGAVLVFRDVSRERQVQEALKDSEEHYRSLFLNMLNGFAYCRMIYRDGKPDDFIYLAVNGAFSKLTGLVGVEGKRVSEVIPAIRELDPDLIRAYGRVAGGGPPERFEIYVNSLSQWYSIAVYCPRPSHFVAIFDVVIERKESEAQRLRLSTAIEQTAEMVVITDAEGTIQYVNPAFESVTGYARTEAIGKTPRILKSGMQDEQFYRHLWATLRSGHSWKGQFINRKKDGSTYPESATISPVFDQAGMIVNFVAAKHDSTRETSLQAQLRQSQKMESVGRLAGGVAHDFNNMLQVIGGYVEILQKDPALTGMQRDHVQQISEAARRSAELTSQLLAFARLQTAAPRSLDLNESVGRTMKLLHRLIGEEVDLVWKPGELRMNVRIDPTQLDQVLANLAVNARDAIAGIGTLALQTEDVTLDESYPDAHPGFLSGRYAVLTVSDTGSGMTAEVRSHLFEPFFTTKPLGKGTGLGLATVYGIVKQNGGFINVYSEPGHGTSFRIYLPAAPISADAAPVVGEPTSPSPKGTETILLVEDEQAILQVSTLLLEGLGYHVLAAASPAEATAIAESHAGIVDLLVTDVIMPQMNGRELSRRLMTLHPGLKCIFMSGYTADAISQHGLLEPGVHFLSKPFTTEQLAAKIRQVLEWNA